MPRIVASICCLLAAAAILVLAPGPGPRWMPDWFTSLTIGGLVLCALYVPLVTSHAQAQTEQVVLLYAIGLAFPLWSVQVGIALAVPVGVIFQQLRNIPNWFGMLVLAGVPAAILGMVLYYSIFNRRSRLGACIPFLAVFPAALSAAGVAHVLNRRLVYGLQADNDSYIWRAQILAFVLVWNLLLCAAEIARHAGSGRSREDRRVPSQL